MGPVSWMLGLCAVVAQATMTPDSTHRILADESVFGLVAYKTGMASGLLDNTFTFPTAYRAQFLRGDRPEHVQFHLWLDAHSMVVNDFAVQTKWSPELRKLSIIDSPFVETSAWRRRRMTREAAGDKLLDADEFPWVEAVSRSVRRIDPPTEAGNYLLGLDITIRGVTKAVEWPGRVSYEGDRIVVETHGPLKFTDFGIQPYSKFLGAVRYTDEFQIFVHFAAEPLPAHTHPATSDVLSKNP
jgi:hypothetical protein